jgi:gluconokinase
MTPQRPLVIMGVAGCGKSSLAYALGKAVNCEVIEGDDFHPPRNKLLMQQGIALTDGDRAGWLESLGSELGGHGSEAILTCSALKRSYRDQLRSAVPRLGFVFLDLDEPTALARVQARASEHFFNPGLVRSQFETLEAPTSEPGVLRLDATLPLGHLCEAVLDWLSQGVPPIPNTHHATEGRL